MLSQVLSSQLPSTRPAPTLAPSHRYGFSRKVCFRCPAISGDGSLTDGVKGLPLSMFTPYKNLPPEGQMAPAADLACDPTVDRCKTPIFTYESKCISCYGTGFIKRHSRGRRSSLCTCLACHGIGYVRRTTARFVPDLGVATGVYTMGRSDQEQEPEASSKSRVAGPEVEPGPPSDPGPKAGGKRQEAQPGPEPQHGKGGANSRPAWPGGLAWPKPSIRSVSPSY